MSAPPVATRGEIRVCADLCETCIFRPGNLMRLEGGRVREMIEEARRNEGTIVCHKTLSREEGVICRGWYDRHADENWMLRVAAGLGVIAEVAL